MLYIFECYHDYRFSKPKYSLFKTLHWRNPRDYVAGTRPRNKFVQTPVMSLRLLMD